MDQIFFIFLLFSILFLIERKAINILICFVGIMITLAIQINFVSYYKCQNGEFNLLSIIDGQYFSYILILVQVSALTILFGFIIMLYPSLSSPKISKEYIIHKNLKEKKEIPFGKILIGVIISLIILIIFGTNILEEIKNFLFLNKNYWLLKFNDTSLKYISYGEDTSFLRKLGYNLYNDEKNIIKLIFLTIILLFAIIALFFLI